MKSFQFWILVVLFLGKPGLWAPGLWAGPADVFAVRSDSIHIGDGMVMQGAVVIRNGLIQAVGDASVIPVDARVLDADTCHVYPGFIDAGADIGLQALPAIDPKELRNDFQNKEGAWPHHMLSPQYRADRHLNPRDKRLAAWRNAGFTAVLAVPQKGLFIGQSALINLAGEKAQEMIVRAPVAMHVGFTPQKEIYPSTQMGVPSFLRQVFLDAEHHRRLLKRYEKQKRGFQRPVSSPALEALFPVLDGQETVVLAGNDEHAIRRALALARERGLKNFWLHGGVEAWRVLDELKNAGCPVLLSLNFPPPDEMTGYSFQLETRGAEVAESDSLTMDEMEKEKRPFYANAARLKDAGIPFAFTSGGMKKAEDFVKHIRLAVKHGLCREDALAALTRIPARILGASDQLGTLEEGKIANLVVTHGDFFSHGAVQYLFIDGVKYEVQNHQKTSPKKK